MATDSASYLASAGMSPTESGNNGVFFYGADWPLLAVFHPSPQATLGRSLPVKATKRSDQFSCKYRMQVGVLGAGAWR